MVTTVPRLAPLVNELPPPGKIFLFSQKKVPEPEKLKGWPPKIGSRNTKRLLRQEKRKQKDAESLVTRVCASKLPFQCTW